MSQANLEDLLNDLLAASEGLYQWRAQMRQIMEDLYLDPAFDEASDDELIVEGRKRIGSAGEQAAITFLKQVTDAYLSGDDDLRSQIRSAFSIDVVLLKYIHTFIFEMTNAIQSKDDVQALRRGLAAASIEENRVDANTMVVLLNDLIDKARSVGIEIDSHIREVAAYSNPEPSTRCYGYSMQDFIRTYASKNSN